MMRQVKVNRRYAPRAPVRTLPTVRLQPLASTDLGNPTADRRFKGIRVQQLALSPGAQYEFAWKGDVHYLSYLDIELVGGETFDGNERRVLQRDLRGKLTFIPSGERVWGWSQARDRHNSFTAIYFDPAELDEDVARRFGNVTRSHLHFEDPSLRETMRKLHVALGASHERDSLYLETLCVLSAIEISRYAQGRRLAAPIQNEDALGRARISRTQELIEANLARAISLSELAEVAGLSRFHFLRTFKRCTGETPYQYVLRRRIETAQTLMLDASMPLEAVARAVGFGSATRFIRAYRLKTGATPGAYRAANASSRNATW